MGVLSAVSLLAPSAAQAQGIGTPTSTYTEVNVANYGARDDAQASQEIGFTSGVGGTTCTLTGTSLACANGLFTSADVGKAIQIPGTGTLHNTTFQTTIQTVTGAPPVTTITLTSAPGTAPLGPVYVTWGTDNSNFFANAASACPANTTVVSLSPFTSRGCTLILPVSPTGTGSYMFGAGVTLSTQTSLQIVGPGNSSRQEQSTQAGVRLITSANITILTIENSGVNSASNDYGAFQLSNITFRDTSGTTAFPVVGGAAAVVAGSGSAIGGLRMVNVSEAVISYCSFENFNGARTGQPAGDTQLSYGMLSDPNINSSAGVPATGFNNNIILIHDKGRNNSVFYDSSLPGQDGPIVIGGDVFPENTVSGGADPNAMVSGSGTSGVCYGFINAGPIRLFGTHLDVRTDNTPGVGMQLPCVGVLMAGGGLVHTKIESSASVAGAASNGTGVYLLGGGTGPQNISTIVGSGTTNGFVTVSLTASSTFLVGELINVTGTTGGHYDGQFKEAHVAGTVITYYQANPSLVSTSAGMVTGSPTIKADLDLLLTNTGPGHGVFIGAGATTNIVNIVSSGDSGNAYTDNNGSSGGANLIEVADAGSGTAVNWTGGTAPMGTATTGGSLALLASTGSSTSGGSAAGDGGSATIRSGAGGSSSGTGVSGAGGGVITLVGAAGGANTSGTNNAGNTGGAGSSITSTAGAGGAAGTGGTGGLGGSIALTGGAGGNGGATSGMGGSITLRSGAPGTGGASGGAGQVLVEPLADSATAFLVESSSASPILDVDTAGGKVGILTSTPGATFDVAGNLQASSSGIVSKYNGVTTAGNGIPAILYTYDMTGLTASATPPSFSPTVAGVYQIGFYLYDFGSGSGCSMNPTVQLTISWTDDGGASGLTQNLPTATVTLPVTAIAGHFAQGTAQVYVKASASVTFSTNYVSGTCATNPSYGLRLRGIAE